MPFVSSVRGNFGLQKKPFPISDGRGSASSTGGTITTAGGYRIHTFTSVGNSTFTFSVAENIGGNGSVGSDGSLNTGATGARVECLIVGAGGGGSNIIAGGGGGGGVLSAFAIASSGSNTITVGEGLRGGYGYNNPGNDYGLKGNNSSALGLTAFGGGGASGWSSFSSDGARDAVINGGSGAGGCANGSYGSGYPSGQQLGGTGVSGQGYPGGVAGDDQPNRERGGGGGGAGQAGFSGYSTVGNGGSGIASSISGTSTYYGGGGGSGRRCNSSTSGDSVGGAGGGGNGSSGCSGGSSGTNGLGGGGGGGAYPFSSSGSIVGGYGGHGVVIIRYPV